jgi:DNA repair protein RadA/Sms
VLYVSGEESPEQIHLRASRLGVLKEGVLLLGEVNVEAVLEHMEVLRPELCIVDSIQTLYTSSMGSAPGSVGQVREVASRLIASAKRLGVPLVLVGHVTKDGAVAGPRVLEHMVDAVLAFEGESSRAYRVLRATKNRFGSTNEIGIFEMASEGLVEVQTPRLPFWPKGPPRSQEAWWWRSWRAPGLCYWSSRPW